MAVAQLRFSSILAFISVGKSVTYGIQGKKNYTEKLFLSFGLSDRVPKDNLYRRLRETLDLSFIYKDTKELYGNTSNPSIDPVVFFKLLITGYLENITSDRKLVEHCSMRMDVLYFLGYDLNEELPWHSTISRTRQLYPASLFEKLFNKAFALCVNSRMVSGQTQAVDSAPIKANASMESVVPKIPATPMDDHLKKVSEENRVTEQRRAKTVSPARITAPEHELKRVEKRHRNLREGPVQLVGASHKKARLLSNKTHYSPHGQDARISVKPGKARKLNYRCSMAVDPVFDSPAQFCGLRKIGVLDKAGAHKVMLLTAIALNLKKYLKKGWKKPSIGTFRAIMDAFRGFQTIFIPQIQSRPVPMKAW